MMSRPAGTCGLSLSIMNSPVPFFESSDALPPVLAGPILRRVEAQRIVLWLAASRELALTLRLAYAEAGQPREQDIPVDAANCREVVVGRDARLLLIDIALAEPLPLDTGIRYDLVLHEDGQARGLAAWAPHLLYPGRTMAEFVVRSRLDNVLFGSCRKPSHPVRDGLVQADAVVRDALDRPHARPAYLLLCGDQVYADDVAGPMLAAIHALIRRLGLYGEYLDGAVVEDSEALYAHPDGFYRREKLLPGVKGDRLLRERFFGGSEKPIFTSTNAHNHLITLAEVLAMYLLVWSPEPWRLVQPRMPALDEEHARRYRAEAADLAGFCTDLPVVARLLANQPTLMIFDDHDITDDWNLSAAWERTAYEHPFSRRIVGNALVAYAFCQGWGNDPDGLAGLIPAAERVAESPDATGHLDAVHQDALIDAMLGFRDWGYALPTSPPLIVLDTRTQRWRNEYHPSRPSGLMDWESLCDLQQRLLDQSSAVIVSPAPMFGVKLIEIIQRVMTWGGQALTVDAENWMAHRGSAGTMLNIFRHSRTPGNYVVLSGDVHYSFAYDIEIRAHDRGPHLWQITSSGLKNEFPRRLLDWMDRVNRWLYAPESPLNRLTKRRDLEIIPRIPDRGRPGERVWNGAGVGQVLLDEQGRPAVVLQHNADGSPPTRFLPAGEFGRRPVGAGAKPAQG